MSKRELAVVFDMVLRHAPLVTFEESVEPPPYDLYSAMPRTTHGDAMALLVKSGLAHVEKLGERTFYRLDVDARAKLGVK